MVNNDSVKVIEEFADKDFVCSVENLINSSDSEKIKEAAKNIALAFGDYDNPSDILGEKESKLVSSFYKNLMLLIQKTWVEKSDESTKEQVLYNLEQFCSEYNGKNFEKSYEYLLSIIADSVYLMFGSQTKSDDFCEYALRVDPEFGIFWWYISNLPEKVQWDSEKLRVAIILGMIFLANY